MKKHNQSRQSTIPFRRNAHRERPIAFPIRSNQNPVVEWIVSGLHYTGTAKLMGPRRQRSQSGIKSMADESYQSVLDDSL